MADLVVLLGEPPSGCAELEAAAEPFGWQIRFVRDEEGLKLLNRTDHIVAVLFSPESMGPDRAGMPWRDALELVQAWTPLAQPLLCHSIANPPSWPELARAGVFHAVRTPLKCEEVRQSLGFVWAARNRKKAVAQSSSSSTSALA